MITDQYTKPLFNSEVASEILLSAGQKMLKAQQREASVYLLSASGRLLSSLQQSVSVSHTGQGLSMLLNYPKHIRFLDLKKTGKKRKKRNYTPIYNKYVYGYIMGCAYKRLSVGLGYAIKRDVFDRLTALNLKTKTV